MLYGAGLRRSEVAALDLRDLDHVSGSMTVRGKGNNERTAYFTNGARLAVEAWLRHRGGQAGPLFLPVSQSGVITMRRLFDQSMHDLLRSVARRASVARLSPHDMRRTFISDAIDAGAHLGSVAALAGHAQVTTTLRYDRRGERARRRAPS